VIRNCIKYDIGDILKEFNISNDFNIEFYIDVKEEKAIRKFLITQRKRLRIILYHIIKNLPNNDIYGSEPFGLKAMKFRSINNARIYCKEIFRDNKKIVLIHFLRNKTFQRASNKKLINKLKSISEYEFKFLEK